MYYYVCMGCGYEWDSDEIEGNCRRCKVGDIYCERIMEVSNDNQKPRIEKDVERARETICTNDVHK